MLCEKKTLMLGGGGEGGEVTCLCKTKKKSFSSPPGAGAGIMQELDKNPQLNCLEKKNASLENVFDNTTIKTELTRYSTGDVPLHHVGVYKSEYRMPSVR